VVRLRYGDDWQRHAGFFEAEHAKVLVRDDPGLELRVPAAGADTVAVMEYLQDHGVEPALWTIEGLGRHDDAVAVAAMAQRDGRQARCLVGGRHASYDTLKHWLQVAAPIPGWTGFAIGSAIWWDALHAHLHHINTAAEARRRIRNAYLDYARYYLSAREGMLPAEPDSVL
jgi:myo-inositol catabolism protein IolC